MRRRDVTPRFFQGSKLLDFEFTSGFQVFGLFVKSAVAINEKTNFLRASV